MSVVSSPAYQCFGVYERRAASVKQPRLPDAEIAEVGFFARAALPEPMRPLARARMLDAFAGRTGILRTFSAADAAAMQP